jgi:hypothetical protein
MGSEAACTVRVGRKSSRGKAMLEGDVLAFRADMPQREGADLRLDIPFDRIRDVGVDGPSLVVRTDEQEARFELTEPVAERWARLIKEPKGLFEKLELGPDSQVAVVDVHDPLFMVALRERTASIVEGRVPQGASTIFFGAETREALRKLPLLRARLVDSGAIWIVRPKGAKAIAESDLFAAMREAGLVDTKVVAFSRTHTAHKCVVPLEQRGTKLRRRPPIVSLPPPAPGGRAVAARIDGVPAQPARKKAARAKAR